MYKAHLYTWVCMHGDICMFACVHAPQDLLAALLSLSAYIQISGYLDTSLYMGGCMYVCMCTCMAMIHLHQKGSDDGSVDRLVPWLHKDCPAWASGVVAERGSLVLLDARVLACPQATFVILSFASFVTCSKSISM